MEKNNKNEKEDVKAPITYDGVIGGKAINSITEFYTTNPPILKESVEHNDPDPFSNFGGTFENGSEQDRRLKAKEFAIKYTVKHYKNKDHVNLENFQNHFEAIYNFLMN
jgi:hypothetical protein